MCPVLTAHTFYTDVNVAAVGLKAKKKSEAKIMVQHSRLEEAA